MRSTRVIATLAGLLPLLTAAPARAHQSPPGCSPGNENATLGDFDFGKSYRTGDVITIAATVSSAANSCDVTNATVTVQFANPDGSFNGPKITAASGFDLPQGSAPTTLPAVQHTIDFGTATFSGDVTVELSGTRHGSPTHSTGSFIGSRTALLHVTHPLATLTVTPSQTSGDPPLAVTYSYALSNQSSHDSNAASDPAITGTAITDDRCSPVVFQSGDTNANDVVDRGETWNFSCTRTYHAAGTFVDHAALQGTSTRDSRPWPATAGQSSVTVNGSDLALSASHTDSFTQGDSARAYSLAVTNAGNATSTGEVGVADTLPSGLTATAIAGTGWSCSLANLSCTRDDALAAGASYPPIAVTVDVARDAPASVTNAAELTLAGDNADNNTASDPTTIGAHAPDTPPTDTGGAPPPGGDGSPMTDGPHGGFVIVPPDLTAPGFTALRLTNGTFAVDPKGAAEPLVSARAKKGTRFAFALTEPARVLFTIEQKTIGRRSGSKCVKQTRRNRRKKKCTLYVRKGAIGHAGVAGANAKAWSGKLGTHALKPASYRAQVVATDAAGNKSAARALSFRVVGR